MTPELRETWTVRRSAVRCAGGAVSTRHHVASEVGARVLSEGGNAVDAAVTGGLALGASGGRRIMPAVMQLVSFLVDFGLDREEAFHAPRIDASGGASITVDPRFAPEVAAALRERYPVEAWPNAVYPAMHACPNGAGAIEDGARVGAACVMSPWALAAPAEPA